MAKRHPPKHRWQNSLRCPVTNKVKLTKNEAKEQLSTAKKRDDSMNTYLCKFCQHWHFGHMNTAERET